MTRTTGILSDASIERLHSDASIIADKPFDSDQVQPASLDLRLGKKAYRVRASFLPGRGKSVSQKLDRFKLHELDLTDGAILETGCVYLVPLIESLDLPADIEASANPKSSTGRLDIFTRVIVDESQAFDQIPAGYKGPLYLEVSPMTFPIVAREGSRLSQIRFRKGRTVLSDDELLELHNEETLVARNEPTIRNGGIGMSIDLKGDENGLVGYRGKRHTGLVDVDKKAAHEILDFWEPIYNHGTQDLVLDPDEFYILVSNEAVHVPGAGSRGVLEVRSHDVPFILEHDQLVGSLVYEHMLDRPEQLYGTDLGSPCGRIVASFPQAMSICHCFKVFKLDKSTPSMRVKNMYDPSSVKFSSMLIFVRLVLDMSVNDKLLLEKLERLTSAFKKFAFLKFTLLKSVREAITPSKFAFSASDPESDARTRLVFTKIVFLRLLFRKSEALKSDLVKFAPEKLKLSIIRFRFRQFIQFTEGAAVSVQAACAELVIRFGCRPKIEVIKIALTRKLASCVFKKGLISNHNSMFVSY